ncbi:conserved hypothetical protein [Methanosalsum zhilinae DSM 4017]|uniref:DUF2150 family protein n=1 Tax=Methanosalsum zhilinae (strain DSM 4017 / NBRC 107636 / OCM 62 / WeN5) TaxID=679901 RepID=F7XPS2_METZD|nr:DUF2150 family protein [Methanosalsum zhilinae]AEH60346.1 conserved hypothetical protein [Methanosalsum zhilinae DSM 4017]
MVEEQIHQEFYTKKRWNNWINKVKEADLKLTNEESGELDDTGLLLVNMQDDVILACLKVIAKFERDAVSQREALHILSQIKDIVLEEIEPISEDIDMMFDSIQTSLMGALAACECYINGSYEKDANIEELFKAAVESEEQDDIDSVFRYVAEIGASVLAGAKLPESLLEDVQYGPVAELMDGIDSISAAMVGADSYKEDDGDYEPV